MSKLLQAFDLLEVLKEYQDYVTMQDVLPKLRFNAPDVIRQQVVGMLVKRNILISQPGRGGGVKPNLARSVSAYDVVDAIEPIDNVPPLFAAQLVYITELRKINVW